MNPPNNNSAKKPSEAKPSSLTRSEFWKAVFTMREKAAEDRPGYDELSIRLEELEEELTTLRDELEAKFDNLPEAFQAGAQGQKLTARADAVDEAYSIVRELERHTSDEDKQNFADEQWQEAIDALNNITCE